MPTKPTSRRFPRQTRRTPRAGATVRPSEKTLAQIKAAAPAPAIGPSAGVGKLKVATYDPDLPPKDQLVSNGQMVLNLEAARDSLISGNIVSYSLPTGVSVTRQNMNQLEEMIRYYRRLAFRDYYGMTSIANLGSPFS